MIHVAKKNDSVACRCAQGIPVVNSATSRLAGSFIMVTALSPPLPSNNDDCYMRKELVVDCPPSSKEKNEHSSDRLFHYKDAKTKEDNIRQQQQPSIICKEGCWGIVA